MSQREFSLLKIIKKFHIILDKYLDRDVQYEKSHDRIILQNYLHVVLFSKLTYESCYDMQKIPR